MPNHYRVIIIEVTIISCDDLTTSSKKPITKNARGVIRVPHCAEVWSTSLDKNGGSYPKWNERFRVEMGAEVRWLEVEICHGMEKVIGRARIPASDFVGGIVPDGYLNCLSYRLRERNGEFSNGIVNLSVRVVGRKRKEELGLGLGFEGGCVVGMPSRVVTGYPIYSGVKQ